MQSSDALAALLRRLYEEEHQAGAILAREATRLGDVPPARALRALAAQGSLAETRMIELARRRAIRLTRAADLARSIPRAWRDSVAMARMASKDRVVFALELAASTLGNSQMLRDLAHDVGDIEIADWTAHFEQVRASLLTSAELELARWPNVAARRVAVIPFPARRLVPVRV